MTWRPLAWPPPDSPSPRFVQIAEALVHEIERGRLRTGDRLPGARQLAEAFGVHRNTVVAATRELESQGWIVTESRRGSFVSGPALPHAARLPRRFPRSDGIGYALGPLPEQTYSAMTERGKLVLAGGRPDPRLIPSEALARAFRRALRRHGHELLDYGDPAGRVELRRVLAQMLSETRGLAVTEDDIVVTRGAQQALHLAAAAIVRPGDRLVVEEYGYPPAWSAFRRAGAVLCPVRVDGHGIVVEDVERELERGPVRAVYVTPHHQFPTMVVMHPARRAALLALARRHRFAVLEDDYDNEYHYEGRPVLPLASDDPGGNVVYVGTLSKVLAPGLRVGYLAAPEPLREHLIRLRAMYDRQGDLAMEVALSELIEDGELRRHTRRMKREYAERRDALVSALRADLGDLVSFDVPPGGMALWVQTALDADAWARRAFERGVTFLPGSACAFDGGPRPFVRMGYARLGPDEIRQAVRCIALAARELTRLPPSRPRAPAKRPGRRRGLGRERRGRETDPSPRSGRS